MRRKAGATASAPGLTEAQIREFALPETFARGREYFESGAVTHLARRGADLQAEVEGSQYTPYQVHVTLAERGLTRAVCTCPYAESWEGACKHIVATLLAWLHAPEQVEEHPPLETVLAPLDRDQLQALVQGLVARQPGLADLIEAQAGLLQSRPAEAAAHPGAVPRRPPVDTASLRRQVRSALRSLDRLRPSEAYWQIGGVVDEVRQLVEQARPFLEAGDGRSALAILEAVTEEYVARWTDLDDSDGEASGLFEELGPLWTEAILSADLTPAERRAWAKRLGDGVTTGSRMSWSSASARSRATSAVSCPSLDLPHAPRWLSGRWIMDSDSGEVLGSGLKPQLVVPFRSYTEVTRGPAV